MKKNLIGLIILIILGTLAFVVFKEQGTGTIKPDLHDFAVKDTAEVTKIFMADKMGQTVLLERKSADEWMVNDTYRSRKDAINLLLKTISRVEMKAPVANTAHDNIIKLLAGKSTKVEIYKGDDLVQTYYVGDATKDNMGTYMLVEGSRTPFICHLPGFNGYLSSRYMTRSLEWRNSEIFSHRLPQITEINVQFHLEPERSFKITHNAKREVQLFKLYPTETLVPNMDTVFVKRYMLNYRTVNFEGIQPYDANRVDSIVNSPPFFSISMTDSDGIKGTVTSYRIPANPDAIDLEGAPLIWDTDRLHGVINGNEDEIALIQYYTFDRLTVPIESLLTDPKLRRDN
ncbi:MAG: hypothetical protein ACI8P5_002557 [Bacteroidia bacterium]|jgi:hypothetical protein